MDRLTTIGIASAKAQIASLVDRAAAGETIVITRKGVAVAQLVAASHGNGQESTPAPRSEPTSYPIAKMPALKPQAPGMTLAEILKASR